jgi:hypothetical protein
MASLAPFRYPVPKPAIHAATAQPKMKSQVRPVGIAHTCCIVEPWDEIANPDNSVRNGNSSSVPPIATIPLVRLIRAQPANALELIEERQPRYRWEFKACGG